MIKVTKPKKESEEILYQRAKDLVIFLHSTGQIKEEPTEEKMRAYWNKIKNKKKQKKV